MKTLHAIMALLLTAGTGCASLQSVSVTNIPRERGRPVEASADNPAFLGLHFDNDFADELPDELRKQCPDGKVTGIYAKYESTWYVLVQNRSVTVHGYCVKGEEVLAAPVSPAPPSAPSDAATSALEPAR